MAKYGIVTAYKSVEGYGVFKPEDWQKGVILFRRKNGREIIGWQDGEPIFKLDREIINGKPKRVRMPSVGDRIVYQRLGRWHGRPCAAMWGYA